MTPFKYHLAVFVAASWYASEFLDYLVPALSFWLVLISVAFWIPLFFLSLGALFRCNWKAVAIFSAAWALAGLPIAKLEPVDQFRFWLKVQGFRIHIAPVERYFSGCKLFAFEEGGVEQQLGKCEFRMLSSNTFDAVFYDTTGQFALPPAQRTQGWQDAMYNDDTHCYLTERAVAKPLFEKFYTVVIEIEHVGGC